MNTNQSKFTFLTSALPYANGDIHIGHLYEWLLSDTYLRYKKIFKQDIAWVCGDDSHGTAITLKAQSLKIKEEDLISNIHSERLSFINKLDLKFDIYSHTHTQKHIQKTQEWFLECERNGYIINKLSKQYFDPSLNIYLNDRQIRGNCPSCSASGQYGDNCEKCGKTYESFELINPTSGLSNAIPILKEVQLCYFDISSFIPTILASLDNLPASVAHKIENDLKQAPTQWCIGRKGDYFGVQIPNRDEKFYVWFDAPIAYISFIEEFFDLDLAKAEFDYDLTHIIGIDIIYFHIVFWQSLLLSQKLPLPKKFLVHGFIVDKDGNKFSKSKNNAPDINKIIREIPLDYIRYFLLIHTDTTSGNIAFDVAEIIKRSNTLGSQFINIFHRLIGLSGGSLDLSKNHCLKRLASPDFNFELKEKIKILSDNGNYKEILALIQNESIKINEKIQTEKLWIDINSKQIILQLLWEQYLFLVINIAPILPNLTKNIINKIKNNGVLIKEDWIWNKR